MYPKLSSSIYKNTPSNTQQSIIDGQTFEVEGATVRAVHTPGHSHDHMCFILEEEDVMFTGDAILGHGTAAVEHLNTWMGTLKTMESYNCSKGYPAHGIVIENLRTKIAGELAQKLRRERQVMKVLQERKSAETTSKGRGNGSITVKELVTAMHGDEVDQGVREMALEPFTEEVLRKLAEDGRVAFEMRLRVKRWFSIDMA
jgi:glyoxylase-like metal-dependent hydrolase (beta-lactamase superfamily II)